MKITNENDFINELSDLSASAHKVNWSLINEESKNALSQAEQAIADYLESNNIIDGIDEEKRNELLLGAISLWEDYKDEIKRASCVIPFSVLELRELYKKTHQSVKYTAETIFYGLHLKKYLLNDLPNTKGQKDYTNFDIEMSFSMAIALYHLLSTVEVSGLNKENYAFASILHKVSEISKIYQEYDNTSARISQQIQMWNKGLSQQIEGTISEQLPEVTMEVVSGDSSEA